MCTYKLELEKQPIAVEIAFTLSQLDVTAIRIFLTEIGNATDNDVFELFVICVPHCLLANTDDIVSKGTVGLASYMYLYLCSARFECFPQR